MPPPSCITIPAVVKHTATVIVAHGLGDSGAGWVSLAENWRRREKFQENFGMTMPGWYDISSFSDLQAEQDEPGIRRSQAYFHSLIKSEIEDSNIPSNRIVIGGFSQGGAMSIFSGITCPSKLGGIFGLSCYLLLHNKLREYAEKGFNKQTKIWMGHGDCDPLVKPEWGRKTAEILREEGYDVELSMYPGLEHSADLSEIDDLEKYLNNRIPPIGDKESL
ncbi:hypothetical protein DID88_005584 [Monilinia fructigena]|uniref:Acyl-protein thioesterase 1 n=1 Tax=Monilinia fructigena TaxID=38457 RepID=A0A395J093_9HELO|nr:hypothetical protein DID88_005584 [Monilinia fructigena]